MARARQASAATIVGLPEFRRELRKLDNPRVWTKELGTIQRDLAKAVLRWSQAEAAGSDGATRHRPFIRALSARGNQREARILVRNPAANAAFWGAKQRTGWNAGNSTPNQLPWVGNSWTVGHRGQGPYAINAAIADHMDDILREYRERIGDLAARAFSD